MTAQMSKQGAIFEERASAPTLETDEHGVYFLPDGFYTNDENGLSESILARINTLMNGSLEITQRVSDPTATLNSSAGSRTYLADRLYVNPTGATVTQQRSTSVRTGGKTRYSLQINGASSVTTCLIGQRIEAREIRRIRRTVTFSAWLYNASGASATPVLLLGTPGAADDFTTVTNRLTQNLQECADSAWTQVYHTVDISGYTNIDNGLQVEIQLPSGSVVASDVWRFAEPWLGDGRIFYPTPQMIEEQQCKRFAEVIGRGFSGRWESASIAAVAGQWVQKRAAPTASLLTSTPTIGEVSVADRVGTASAIAASVLGIAGGLLLINGFSSATSGNMAHMATDRAILLTAEL